MGPTFDDKARTIDPSPSGRNHFASQVLVYGHHSDVHDGANIEIDAPEGARITVHLNEGLIVDVVIPS